jgi:hypothetical protein
MAEGLRKRHPETSMSAAFTLRVAVSRSKDVPQYSAYGAMGKLSHLTCESVGLP